MIILSTLFLLISNAVSLRRDVSILYNRIVIIALLYATLQNLVTFTIISNGGIGIHGGLFHVTTITQVFHIFLYFISILILQLTSFYPAARCGKSPMWVKLSNSGYLLKLMIPSYNWKVLSGQVNNLCMVTSHKMSENEMDYRGSKSIVSLVLVRLLVFAISPFILFNLTLVVLHFNELLFSNFILLARFPFYSNNFSSSTLSTPRSL